MKNADPNCIGPLCIRTVRRLENGDVTFTLEWSTSLGRIQSRGWKWIYSQNRFDARCGKFYIAKVTPDARRSIRKLLTRVVLEKFGYAIQPRRREAGIKDGPEE